MFATAYWLFIGHFVGDFALQSDSMESGKKPSSSPGLLWVYWMSAHAAVHAAAVTLATGSTLLGTCEFVAHWIIDLLKSRDAIGFHLDQLLHLLCKAIWLALLSAGYGA